MSGDWKHLKPKQRAFLASFVETGGRVEVSAKLAGISKVSHYGWLKEDEAYAGAFSEAKLLAGDVLEDEARRRAVEGVSRLRFHKGEPIMVPLVVNGELVQAKNRAGKPRFDRAGKPVYEMVPYVEHEYSDTLLIVLLKMAGRFVERHRIDQPIEHHHTHKGTVEVVQVRQELMNDPDYLEYCRTRAIDVDSRPVCEDGEPRALEDGSASGPAG